LSGYNKPDVILLDKNEERGCMAEAGVLLLKIYWKNKNRRNMQMRFSL